MLSRPYRFVTVNVQILGWARACPAASLALTCKLWGTEEEKAKVAVALPTAPEGPPQAHPRALSQVAIDPLALRRTNPLTIQSSRCFVRRRAPQSTHGRARLTRRDLT